MSHLLGDVQAKSVHDVSEEEQVDLAFAIPVVDVADVLNLWLRAFVSLKDKFSWPSFNLKFSESFEYLGSEGGHF